MVMVLEQGYGWIAGVTTGHYLRFFFNSYSESGIRLTFISLEDIFIIVKLILIVFFHLNIVTLFQDGIACGFGIRQEEDL